MLMRRGDSEARGVIVGSEVRSDASSPCRLHQRRQHEDRLRRLDHHLHLYAASKLIENIHQRRDLLRHRDLGQRDDKMLRHVRPEHL
jgi:hypothetical protein